ncbi:MAG: hypothetical protein KBT46_01370 [Ruminococcus sp.]|nr:hypothetical protein [Candidatus Copronaster equi]
MDLAKPYAFDALKMYPKYVVTMDDLASGNINGIKICHLADFLLREDY